MSKPTRADAELFVKLYEMFTNSEIYMKAWDWWQGERWESYKEFSQKHPIGSEGRKNFMLICGYFELLGALVYHELLDVTLIAETFGVPWRKAEPVIIGWRAEIGNRKLYENFQWLAMRCSEWREKRPPKFPKD